MTIRQALRQLLSRKALRAREDRFLELSALTFNCEQAIARFLDQEVNKAVQMIGYRDLPK